jgi:integrase/recombinase XerC
MTASFLNYLAFEKKSSTHTQVAYQNDLAQFTEFCTISFNINDISKATHSEIRAWVIDLVEQELHPNSVNRKIATLKSFYKFLMRSGEIEKDPTYKIKSLKSPKRLPEFIQEDAIEKILAELNYEPDFEGQRDRMVMEFLYLTGVRLSELLNLKWKDIDFHQNLIKVLGKRNKERMIPMTNWLKKNIQHYKEAYVQEFTDPLPSQHFIAGKDQQQVYPMKVYRIVKHRLSLYAQTTKRSPHLLRHTFATHLLNKGADLNAVKDLLGHANLAATQVYTHNSIEKLKAVFEQAHPKA